MPAATHDLVGRDRLLASLDALVDQLVAGQRVTAVVSGEAGIGKTSLLRAATSRAATAGALTAWGTCLDLDAAPGFWPWTQALEGLLRTLGTEVVAQLLGDDAALVATIAPSAGEASSGEGSERDRLLAMDATRRLLDSIAADRPLLVILDDLQWADASSLDLIDLVTRSSGAAGLAVICAFRDDELPARSRQRLSSLTSSAEHLHVDGLDIDGVRALVERVTGSRPTRDTAAAAHRRSGGHPFFVRELALLGGLDGRDERLPTAVRDAIHRRIETLPAPTVSVLEAAALAGPAVDPGVLVATLGLPSAEIDAAIRAALGVAILVTVDDGIRFAHDLLRETLEARVDGDRRATLHRAIGTALEERMSSGAVVAASEVARHFVAAVSLDGPARALHWALAAARADRASLAFAEAAGQLRRLRGALAAAAVHLDDESMVEVLLGEADALVQAGSPVDARGLLRHAADLAERAGPSATALVALATARLGARFATRRDEIVHQLDRAREVIDGCDDALEARVTATLARELQHSVAEDRPRAAALSERALDLGRRSGDSAALLDCLLARHDVLWEPGAADARGEIAREIIEVAIASGDDDRHADGLLLLSNALLEHGSAAFEGPLEACLAILEERGQPRHRYTALTRHACVALLRNRLDDAERLIDDAKELGDRILEPDAGNVYMSQRLELVRARGDADELSAFAAAAIGHWTGAPVHSHGVAAGFLARAGDLAGAERHVAAVIDLGTWRVDRSYLWSVFVRELAQAAVAIGDRALCEQLLEDLLPLADSCGVNGAVVAFAGSHAQPAGLLAAALGQHETAELLLERAAATYRRLGSTGWMPDRTTAVTAPPAASARATASIRRDGSVWHLVFAGREATVAHSKGLADIARLLGAPGSEIHVLDLFDPPVRSAVAGEIVDRRALGAYRDRLVALDAEIDEADGNNDPERRARAELERQGLLDEIARVTGTGGRRRHFANHPAERARKAVSGRVRDAIRKLESVLPELASHLERTVVTGTYCRYRPDGIDWTVDTAAGP